MKMAGMTWGLSFKSVFLLLLWIGLMLRFFGTLELLSFAPGRAHHTRSVYRCALVSGTGEMRGIGRWSIEA